MPIPPILRLSLSVTLWMPGLVLAQDLLTCESNNQRVEYCPADTRDGIALYHQQSRAGCFKDATWGTYPGGIWVGGGCRATFLLGSAWSSDSHVERGDVAAGIAAAAIVGGILWASTRTRESDPPHVPIVLSVAHPPSRARINGGYVTAFELQIVNQGRCEAQLQQVAIEPGPMSSQLYFFEGPTLAALMDGGPRRSDPSMLPIAASGGQQRLYPWLRDEFDRPTSKWIAKVTATGCKGKATTSQLEFTVPSAARHQALSPPLRGGPWVAVYDPALERGHRRVHHSHDGRSYLPGRFAIDWFRVNATGRLHAGDQGDPTRWFGHGEDVLAVADGTVVAARGDAPDHRVGAPNTASGSPEEGAGNYVVLDLGDGRFAVYEHLLKGTIAVGKGDRVKRGQLIAAVGNSGDTAGPHLHFHVADAKHLLESEGLPFEVDRFHKLGRYESLGAVFSSVPWGEPSPPALRQGEMPAENEVLRFP